MPKETEIINKYNKVPIYEEIRFNEIKNNETWKEFQTRNMHAIDDIIKKHNNDDFIICVSSGVNLSSFVSYFTKQLLNNHNPVIQAITISPVLFSTDNKCL